MGSGQRTEEEAEERWERRRCSWEEEAAKGGLAFSFFLFEFLIAEG